MHDLLQRSSKRVRALAESILVSLRHVLCNAVWGPFPGEFVFWTCRFPAAHVYIVCIWCDVVVSQDFEPQSNVSGADDNKALPQTHPRQIAEIGMGSPKCQCPTLKTKRGIQSQGKEVPPRRVQLRCFHFGQFSLFIHHVLVVRLGMRFTTCWSSWSQRMRHWGKLQTLFTIEKGLSAYDRSDLTRRHVLLSVLVLQVSRY